MRKSVIFIQAAADVRHAINIIEDKSHSKYIIYVVHVYDIYSFLVNNINLPVEIKFIPSVNIKKFNPLTIFSAKLKLKKLWENTFKDREVDKVYFFSRFFDQTTSFLIRNFVESNIEVIYMEHYDDVSVEKAARFRKNSFGYLNSLMLSKIISYYTGAKFITRFKQKYIELDVEKYPIKKVKPLDVLVKEVHKYKITDNNKKILLFLQPLELEFLTNQSTKEVRDIIDFYISKSFKVYLKGHPRLGTPIEYTETNDIKLIPNYIPSEFISTSDFNFVFGIVSSSLKVPAMGANNVYSLNNVLIFKDKEKQDFFYNYLKKFSNERINFPESIEQVKALCK